MLDYPSNRVDSIGERLGTGQGIRPIDTQHNRTNQSRYHVLYFLVLRVAVINLVLAFLNLLFHL